MSTIIEQTKEYNLSQDQTSSRKNTVEEMCNSIVQQSQSASGSNDQTEGMHVPKNEFLSLNTSQQIKNYNPLNPNNSPVTFQMKPKTFNEVLSSLNASKISINLPLSVDDLTQDDCCYLDTSVLQSNPSHKIEGA